MRKYQHNIYADKMLEIFSKNKKNILKLSKKRKNLIKNSKKLDFFAIFLFFNIFNVFLNIFKKFFLLLFCAKTASNVVKI